MEKIRVRGRREERGRHRQSFLLGLWVLRAQCGLRWMRAHIVPGGGQTEIPLGPCRVFSFPAFHRTDYDPTTIILTSNLCSEEPRMETVLSVYTHRREKTAVGVTSVRFRNNEQESKYILREKIQKLSLLPFKNIYEYIRFSYWHVHFSGKTSFFNLQLQKKKTFYSVFD